MTKEVLADRMVARAANLQGHFDLKLTALQAHIYGNSCPWRDMLDIPGEIGRLREAVNDQAKAIGKGR